MKVQKKGNIMKACILYLGVLPLFSVVIGCTCEKKVSQNNSINSEMYVSFVGPAGSEGPVGHMGAQGKVGATGAPGAGIAGAAGEQGPSGSAGIRGQTGATGAAGCVVRGSPGVTGPVGPEGPQGVRGDTGEQGASIAGPHPAQLVEAVPQARKAYAVTRAIKARRSLVLPAPLAEAVPQVCKAWPEIPVPEAPPRPVLLVQPDLPVMQARKAQKEIRAHEAQMVWLTDGLHTGPFGSAPKQRTLAAPIWIRCLKSQTTCRRTRHYKPESTDLFLAAPSQDLADLRVNSVRSALIEAGVPVSRIETGAFGDTNLARERRVEVLLRTNYYSKQ